MSPSCVPPVSYWGQDGADILVPHSLRTIPNIDKASIVNTRKVINAKSEDPSVFQNQKEMVKGNAGYHLDAGMCFFNVMVSLLPIRASAASHFTEKSIKMEGDGQSRYKKETSQVKTGCPRNRKTLQSLLGIGRRRIYLSWSLHPHCRESLVSGQRSRQACQLS